MIFLPSEGSEVNIESFPKRAGKLDNNDICKIKAAFPFSKFVDIWETSSSIASPPVIGTKIKYWVREHLIIANGDDFAEIIKSHKVKYKGTIRL